MNSFFDEPQELTAFFRETEAAFAPKTPLDPKPANIPTRLNPLKNIRVILWDIYGTLCGAKIGDLQDALAQRDAHVTPALAVINKFSLQISAENLVDLYHDLIAQSHRKSHDQGVEYPEVHIDKIWQQILKHCHANTSVHLAYQVAYYYDCAFQGMQLYPMIADCLSTLRDRGFIQGIISNAQFYTPIRLKRLLGQDLGDIFTESLVYFSYELGYSKPNPLAFQRAIETLQPQNITPDQILFIGNDMLNDVATAQESGFRTMLFAGDESQTKLRADVERCRNVEPDAIVTHANQICGLL